jgi:hypothetical protein
MFKNLATGGLILMLSATTVAGQSDQKIALPARQTSSMPAVVEVSVPRVERGQAYYIELVAADGKVFGWGQVGRPRLNSGLPKDRDALTAILPPGVNGGGLELTMRPAGKPNELFAWSDHESKYSDLRLGDRPVLRYMYEALDKSSPARIEETYKAYHHLFDLSGKTLVTKGPGGLYPHHRGLFFGFNKISYGDQQADVWHCKDGEFQAHVQFVSADVGPVYGRHQVQIDWHGRDGTVFASEIRELTAYNVANANLIEFRSRLSTTLPKVRLDGDPQHAGFQFRASQFVPDNTAKQTYYLRPDGKDQPGNFRNWSNQPNETEVNLKHVDLPWNALSFVMEGDKRFTCCYLDHPANPKPARFSERDYGRFGSYFEYDLTPDSPLEVQYRLWLQEGEMTVEQVAALSEDFAKPIQLEPVKD